jgi:hypothetical protein
MVSSFSFPLFCERFMNALATVVEDPPHVAANLQRMNPSPEDAQRQPVPHHIDHLGSTLARFKAVRAVPKLYGPDLYEHDDRSSANKRLEKPDTPSIRR